MGLQGQEFAVEQLSYGNIVIGRDHKIEKDIKKKLRMRKLRYMTKGKPNYEINQEDIRILLE